ncbi:host cell division inhibitor Icd-like protein [Salmonella enterica]|nr:host cell division inhibitor Icd-like protein [Salmonella enterica]EAX3607000.1 host cell division inhibitor Icd-like protein [Salmonella enterica]EGW6280481.1 host cell division inhibitor Icd-like protein [Salmonella enterica]EGX3932326.1 host cell division inhibitor Icd-like protein [Salmonella enterica]
MRNNRPCFVWRFVSGQNAATYTTTAASEREARLQLPAVRLVFAARIRVNGGGNMSDFMPLGAHSHTAGSDGLYLDGNASAEALFDTAISRVESVMQLHAAMMELPPATTINAAALSAVSTHLLSDARSLLLELQHRTERYGDARELVKRHAIAYSALAERIREQGQTPGKQEESSRV